MDESNRQDGSHASSPRGKRRSSSCAILMTLAQVAVVLFSDPREGKLLCFGAMNVIKRLVQPYSKASTFLRSQG